ncbi:MAG: hypothetical protein JWO58_3289 [Chitinophagaceae bacterium]|nr:hypothetical protein [Chitinophagaceae bacterium]
MNEELIEAARQTGIWLQAQGLQLVTAESCTGGLIAAAMTEIAGSSVWFDRGFVTYSNDAKQAMLGVQPATLTAFGAVSEQTVREMALGALVHSVADVAVAVSGIAGPSGGTSEKPVGMVCFAWASRPHGNSSSDVHVKCHTRHFPGERAAVRNAAALHALQFILNMNKSQVIDMMP